MDLGTTTELHLLWEDASGWNDGTIPSSGPGGGYWLDAVIAKNPSGRYVIAMAGATNTKVLAYYTDDISTGWTGPVDVYTQPRSVSPEEYSGTRRVEYFCVRVNYGVPRCSVSLILVPPTGL